MKNFDELFTDEKKDDGKKKYTINGLTNELEDITDEQVSNIKAELTANAPADKEVTERDLDIDARRVFLGRTTVDRVIKMYQERC